MRVEFTPEMVVAIDRLRAKREKWETIAEAIGVAVDTLRRFRRRCPNQAWPHTTARRFSPEFDREILTMPPRVVAARHGVSVDVVDSRKYRLQHACR